MTDAVVTVASATALAVLTGLVANPILRRLPEPAPTPDDEKVPYADLADRRFALGCALISFALGLTSSALLPPRLQTPWAVLATLGVLLAMIDLRTTWLPKRLTQLGWLLMAAAVVITEILSGDRWLGVRALAAALAAGALYGLVWAASRGGGFGFGDVRYAPLIGAAAGSHSWMLWGWALLLGTLVGGLAGVLRLIRGRREGFPYAPSMLLGCYLALAASALT